MKFNKINANFLSSINFNIKENNYEDKKMLFQNSDNGDDGGKSKNGLTYEDGKDRSENFGKFKLSKEKYSHLLAEIKQLKISGNFSENEQNHIAKIEEKIINLGGVAVVCDKTLMKVSNFLELASDKSDKTTMTKPIYIDIIKELNDKNVNPQR